ncbi:MauE/DoxX family redox-associated membrane protein [Chitinophaga sp.]|uniref:MauE/DoxX family redox-associated membrane protein n=1 Tax=Chitinophaga sp. TaxID=1869181 RepID=UPI0031D8C400
MRKVTIETISLLLVVLFLYTAVSKIIDYSSFKATIGQSPLLANISGFVAFSVPLVEIVLTVLLLVPRTKVIGLYASFTLLVMFTAYIIVILNFSDRIPCSCGGVIGQMGWTAHVFFNIGFVLLTGVAIVLGNHAHPRKQAIF